MKSKNLVIKILAGSSQGNDKESLKDLESNYSYICSFGQLDTYTKCPACHVMQYSSKRYLPTMIRRVLPENRTQNSTKKPAGKTRLNRDNWVRLVNFKNECKVRFDGLVNRDSKELLEFRGPIAIELFLNILLFSEIMTLHEQFQLTTCANQAGEARPPKSSH